MTAPLQPDFDLADNPPNPEPKPGPAPGVFIVREGRASSGRLLPPVLIVLAGATFLAYRSGRADWRGLDAFRRWSWPTITWTPPAAGKAGPRAGATHVPRIQPTPAPGPSLALKAPEPSPKPADAPRDKAASEADPLDEITREAERTKGRIAELERAKAEEARRLDETADERREADRASRGRPRLRLPGGIPADLDKLMREMQREQSAQFEAFERDARKQMEQMRRNFLGGRMPGMPGPGMGFPFDRGNARGGFGGWPPGVTIRESRGPGGVRRFEMRWGNVPRPPRPDNDENDDVPPPPVPQPEPRRID